MVKCMLPENDYIDVNTILNSFVGPWYRSLENPAQAQETTLQDLLKSYSATDYGASHNAQKTTSITDYQANFPIVDYKALQPYFKQVQEGNLKRFCPKHPKPGS